jgi:hypothetical protein
MAKSFALIRTADIGLLATFYYFRRLQYDSA